MFKKILALVLIVLFSVSCNKPKDKIIARDEKKEATLTAVVVFSVGESRITHADATEERAVLGASFKSGDKITTGPKSRVDIQLGDKSAIRITSNSSMEFSQLLKTQGGSNETKLFFTKGKLYVNVNKENKNDSFTVSTPTLVAGVRGTAFTIEIDKDEDATVKVVDGSVAVSPRVPSFEKVSPADIDKNAGLKKLNQALQSSEVILEKDQQILLPANEKVLAANKLDTRSVNDMIAYLGTSNEGRIEAAELTKNEQQELKTIISVDPKVAQEMIRLNEELSSGRLDEAKAEELENRRATLESQVLSKQEVEKNKFNEQIVVEPRRLRSNKEIIRYYERIEKIVLITGKTEIGAIINQEDNIMIVHTEDGIVRINTAEVLTVEYDYQTKYKF